MNDFPCTAPTVAFDPIAAPDYPPITLPGWDVKIVAAETGVEIDFRVDMLRKVYATEVAQVENLKRMVTDIEDLIKMAGEAKDLMDIHIANEQLAYREAQNSSTAQFNACKQNWEQQNDQQLEPLSSIYKEYKAHNEWHQNPLPVRT